MKKYYTPTPIWARKFGDSLMGASATITTYALLNNDVRLGIIALWVGVGGKFLSNLFSDDNTPPENKMSASSNLGNDGDIGGGPVGNPKPPIKP